MCSYFDDAFLAEENAYGRHFALGYLSSDEVAAVGDFHQMADRYQTPNGDDWDIEGILCDPNWRSVVEAARRAQQRLLPLLTDQAEIAALTQPLRWDERNGAFSADLIGSRIVIAD